MIQYNNQNSFKEIHYNGHDIQKVYCDTGDLVWQKQSPGPTPFEGKWLATYDGGSTSSAECDSTSTISQYEISLTNLLNVQIGDCVTSIGDNAFNRCYNLTSCTIGSGVRRIGNYAFYKCYNLTSVTVNATTPPTLGNDAFYDTNNCPIYVPSASVNTYKSASGWSDYSSRIQAIPNS